jgi:speckle-type POZ protein
LEKNLVILKLSISGSFNKYFEHQIKYLVMTLNGYIENLKTIETNSSLIKTAFDYKIDNFLTLNNSEIISPTFRIRDTKWLVKVFTCFWKHNIEYIEIALCLNESNRAVNKAKFRISIINNNKRLKNTLDTEIYEVNIGEHFRVHEYVRRNELKADLSLLPNNRLELHFVLDLFDCNQNNENLIGNDLQKLVNDKKYSDFVFVVDNKKIFAHKNILSVRSKVFEAMFANDMIECHVNKCVIQDVEFEVFEELLTFIYTGKSPKAFSMADKLIAAAEKYEVLDLKEICEDIVFNGITNQNAIQSLITAEKYNAMKSIDKIIDFIAENLSLILKESTIEWKQFIVENPNLVLKIFEALGEKKSRENEFEGKNWISRIAAKFCLDFK